MLRRSLESGQYTSIAFTQRLIAAGVDASVGSVGDALGNAMAESTIGSFKTELIHHHGLASRRRVEIATLDRVYWFNTDRSHDGNDDLAPIATEQLYYAHQTALAQAG